MKHISFIAALVLYSSNVVMGQARIDTFTLPPPYFTKSVKNFSKVIGWKEEEKPIAPEGFIVSKFAGDLKNPRWIYVAPNGDVFVAEAGTRIPEKKRKDESDDFFNSKSQNFGSANQIIL